MMWPVVLILTIAALTMLGLSALADEQDAFFPILPWDGLRGWDKPVEGYKNPIESVAECNFTVAGFVQPKDLPTCEKLGLKAIVAPPPGQESWKKWGDVPIDAIDESVKRWVQAAGNSSAIMGYFIIDEPGTPKFPTLAKAVDAIKKYAPNKLAYINLFPGYATIGAPDKSQLGAASYTEYLEKFVVDVKPQLLSYDDYKIITSDNLQSREEGAVYFKDLMEVRRVSLEHGIPFWNTVCSNRIRPYTTVPSPANLLLQAYTTLAAGGRGLAWYKYYQDGYAYAPIDKAGKRTDTWYYLQMVNRQIRTVGPIMNRLTSTGVYFSNPTPADGLPLLPGRLIERVESRSSLKGHGEAVPPLMIGEFADRSGGDYVMVVNLSLEKSANFLLHTVKPYAGKDIFSAADSSTLPLDEKDGQWLVPGQGVLIRLVSKKEETL